MRTNRLFALALSMSLMAFNTLQPLLAEDGGLKAETPALGGGSSQTTPTTTSSDPSASTTDGLKPEAAAMAQPGLRSETPALAPANGSKASSLFPEPSDKKTGEASLLHSETPKLEAPRAEKPAPAAAPKKSTMLYGRIEELTAGAGASFPLLAPMKAKMDPREQLLKAGAQDNKYSGSVVKAFPPNYQGVWGGTLKLWSFQQDPLCYKIDPAEAAQTAKLMQPGMVGNVNFMFANDGGKMSLEPAQVAFSVPISQTDMAGQLNQMFGAQGASVPGMGNMMQQMMGNMQVPIILHFGEINNSMERGVSGNTVSARVVKNVIRELKPGVLEQQLVTSESERIASTGKIHNRYSETVVRFTRQSESQLYVQAACVNYNADGHFERKEIMFGTVAHGQQTNTSPIPAMPGMPGMQQMMQGGGQGGAGGMGGLDQMMRQMMQQGGGQGGANPFKGLF